MTSGANWCLPKAQSEHQDPKFDNPSTSSVKSLTLSLDSDVQSPNSQTPEEITTISDIEDVQLKIGASMLFIISASNSSLVVDLSSGSFFEFPGNDANMKDLGDGNPEDFQYNPCWVSSVIPVPYQSFSPHHSTNDRYIMGVGSGRTGALHRVQVGSKLQMIMQGKWYEELPKLFTAKAYSGAKLHSLLLVEEKKLSAKENDDQKDLNQSENKQTVQKKLKQKPFTNSETFTINLNTSYTYTSTVFALHEDVVEPIDSFVVGIDSSKKTVAFGSAQGAFVQITSSEVRIIPTPKITPIEKGSISQSGNQATATQLPAM
ncbi:MAG: hypothetical protein EZS28_045258, partial [Streblomastix strix]